MPYLFPAVLALFLFAAPPPASPGDPPAPSGPPVLQRVEFRDLPLSDALRLLAEESGLNLVASAEAGRTRVTIFLRGVGARAAVEEICRSHDLWFREDALTKVLRVMTLPEFQRDLQGFREEETQVFTLLYPNAEDVAVAVQDLYGDRVVLSFGREDQGRELENRFRRFDILDQRSQGLGFFAGGGTSVFQGPGVGRFSTADGDTSAGSGGRRVAGAPQAPAPPPPGEEFQRLTPEQAKAVEEALRSPAGSPEGEAALKALRRRQATLFVSVVRRNNLVIVRTSDLKALEEIRALVQKIDVPTPLLLLEVKVLSVNLGDDFSSIFDAQWSDGARFAGGFTTGDILPPASDAVSGSARRSESLAPEGTGIRPGDFLFQYVSNGFRARLQMLETRGRVTTLATPLLLTANDEVARLFVGEERPIVRNISSQTIVGGNVATSAPNTTVEFRPVGTTLLLTPNINADRTVTLRILQENSTILRRAATIPVVTGEGVSEQAVDVVSTRTVSGTIVAKDGHTVALGGLIEEGVGTTRTEVPILGKIPLLGFFFRREVADRTRREFVLLVRPYVLWTPAEADALRRTVVGDLSVHPAAPDARGTMGTFRPEEAPRPKPPPEGLEKIFRFHSVEAP